MTRSLSQKFRFFTFVCIALLSYVHGYNLNETYLAPWTTVTEQLSFTTFFEYLFANGLLRFRIPLLFLISGYLYALYDHRPYWQQIKGRFRSLIIPYLLWSALGLLFTFVLQQFPYTANIVLQSRLDQLGDNRPYTEIGWNGIMFRWLIRPISYQLWFISVLFFFNLFYPLFKWLVVKIPYIWLPLTFLFFFSGIFSLPFLDSRGLFFFCLGIWLQKRNFSLEQPPQWFSLGLTLILFLGLSVIKTFMAFELDPNSGTTGPTLLILHQLAIVMGIFAMWFGADKVIHWFMNKKWFHSASSFSFFIFGIHVPLLPYVMQWALLTLDFLPLYRLVCYLLIPLIVIIFSVWVGKVLRHYLPSVYAVLTGGRGF